MQATPRRPNVPLKDLIMSVTQQLHDDGVVGMDLIDELYKARAKLRLSPRGEEPSYLSLERMLDHASLDITRLACGMKLTSRAVEDMSRIFIPVWSWRFCTTTTASTAWHRFLLLIFR